MDGQTECTRDVEDDRSVDKLNRLTEPQLRWLQQGLSQTGGKLPLFDYRGQRISSRTVKSCIRQGWAEPWFNNPIKPDWQVCRLTDLGRQVLNSVS